MGRFLILVGYIELSMYLYLSGKLDQYINTRYTYLAFVAMFLAFVLAMVQLTLWVRQLDKRQQKPLGWLAGITLLFPIFVGLFIPTVTLDATTVASKGYSFPLAVTGNNKQTSEDGTDIQYLSPDTSLYFTKATYNQQMAKSLKTYKSLTHIEITAENYMEVMELIYHFPDQFVGKTISYTGFVYRDKTTEDDQFLFRFGIIHCIADSGVYGLLTKGDQMRYDNNTWIAVTGRLTNTYSQSLGQTLPTLIIEDSSAIDPPQNPYVYRTFY